MSDLTIGDIGVTLKEQLVSQDITQDPAVQIPLDLTNAQKVELLFVITAPDNNIRQSPTVVQMGILGVPTAGVVFYIFKSGDLVKPLSMGKYGVLRYSIKVTFNNGNILYTNTDGQLTIKDDSVL